VYFLGITEPSSLTSPSSCVVALKSYFIYSVLDLLSLKYFASKVARDDACHNCDKLGHWAKECRQPRCGQAHVTQVEEPALLLAHASIELSPAVSVAAALLHLDELRAHALLGDGSSNDKTDGWCLDTGATHHMTDRWKFFTEFDSDVRGSVKFGEASDVEIKGVGSVIFATESGEHILLTGVYYIPALRNSIISLGQLDKSGSRVEIKNRVMRIWDRHRRLLDKVSHLRVFGCLAFGKELGHISKLNDRSTPGVFIGYAEGSKAYLILDPGTQRVRTTRDVVFDEGRGWAWDKAVDNDSTPTYDNFTIEYVHFEGAGGVNNSLPPSMSTPVPEPPPTSAPRSPATTSAATRSSPPPPQLVTPCTPAATATPPGTSTPTPARVENPVEFATPLSHDEERIDAYHDGEPLRYHTMENLLSDQRRPVGAGTGPSRSGGTVASCVRRRQASVRRRGRETRGMACRDAVGDGRS
jgi:hypothetical protein